MSAHRPKVFRGKDGRWRFSCTVPGFCLYHIPIFVYPTHRGALFAANQHARRKYVEALIRSENPEEVMPR